MNTVAPVNRPAPPVVSVMAPVCTLVKLPSWAAVSETGAVRFQPLDIGVDDQRR